MLLKDCVLVSQTELMIYTQTILNMAHPFYFIVFHVLLIVCYVIDMHAPVFLHGAVIPIPKNTKLNLYISCNYRAIALSSIFSKILDETIMSLQSEYLMTSELQFGFKEHSSTIMCSTLLVETVEYYGSNNSTVYVLLIDASKAFDRLCHSKLFEVRETYNVCPLVRRLMYNSYSRSEIHVQGNSIFLEQLSKTGGSAFSNFIFHLY